MFEDVRDFFFFQRTLLGHKIYNNQGEGFQVGKTVSEDISRVWLARDDSSEWKQWVLLRLPPYHWQACRGFSPLQT